jgi:hypothetical protein
MHKNLLLTAATVAILCAGSLASISAQAAPRTTAAKSAKAAVTVQHRTARSDITSFSSSSAPAALNVGVNHPAKK